MRKQTKMSSKEPSRDAILKALQFSKSAVSSWLVWFDSLRPSQSFLVMSGQVLKQSRGFNVLLKKTKCSAFGETQTRGNALCP